MVGAVDFIDAPLELGAADPATPQCAVPMGPGRNEAKAVTRSRADWCGRNSLDHRGIHLLLSAITIDNGARNILDNGSESGADRSPAQAIYQRVFEGLQRLSALRGISQNGGIIVAPGMRYRQQDW